MSSFGVGKKKDYVGGTVSLIPGTPKPFWTREYSHLSPEFVVDRGRESAVEIKHIGS